MLRHFLETVSPETQTFDTFNELRRLAFLQWENNQWKIHRLLQRVVRESFELSNSDKILFLTQGWLAYEKTFGEKIHEDDIPRVQEGLSHAKAWISHITSLSSVPENTRHQAHWLIALGKGYRLLSDSDNLISRIFMKYQICKST